MKLPATLLFTDGNGIRLPTSAVATTALSSAGLKTSLTSGIDKVKNKVTEAGGAGGDWDDWAIKVRGLSANEVKEVLFGWAWRSDIPKVRGGRVAVVSDPEEVDGLVVAEFRLGTAVWFSGSRVTVGFPADIEHRKVMVGGLRMALAAVGGSLVSVRCGPLSLTDGDMPAGTAEQTLLALRELVTSLNLMVDKPTLGLKIGKAIDLATALYKSVGMEPR